MKPGDLYTNRRGQLWFIIDVYTQILWDERERVCVTMLDSDGRVTTNSRRWVEAFRWKVEEDEAW